LVGQITSPDKRNAIAKEFKRTHFILGGQGISKTINRDLSYFNFI
jgi:hypothetical protein